MNDTARPSGSDSYFGLRILAGIFALPLTLYSVPLVAAVLMGRGDILVIVFGSGTTTAAILCSWFALYGHFAETRRRIKFALLGGVIFGGIGFVGGFFGPIILKPESNQGPLLGIFVTGPLGFVLGTVIGWLYALFILDKPRVSS